MQYVLEFPLNADVKKDKENFCSVVLIIFSKEKIERFWAFSELSFELQASCTPVNKQHELHNLSQRV